MGSLGDAADRDLGRRLGILTAARLLILGLFLAFVSLVYLRGQTGGVSSAVAFATIGGAFFAALVHALLLRLKQYRIVGYLQLVTDQLAWTAVIYITGGVGSGAVSLLGLTCVMGAIAIGLRGAVVGFSVGILFYLALSMALIGGTLPPPSDQDIGYILDFRTAVTPIGTNIFALLVVTIMSGNLAERLRRTGGELVVVRARAEAAERLAALGRLSTGLAHEIRNPLGGIMGSIELLAMSPHLDEEDKKLCQIVSREAVRLNDLVTDMLTLSRPRLPERKSVAVGQIVGEVVQLAQGSGRGVDVDVEADLEGDPKVLADEAQLRQLLWNLIRNAVQASSAGDVVRVVVREDTEGVRLSVIDQGPGIAPQAMEQIFDAFFTTRSHGTGVGLAVVKQIIDQHGWTISVERAEGTVFAVLIPAPAQRSDAVRDE